MSVRLPGTLRPPSKQEERPHWLLIRRSRRMLVTQERERELGETEDEVSPETDHRPLFPPPRVSSASSPLIVYVDGTPTDSPANNMPDKIRRICNKNTAQELLVWGFPHASVRKFLHT
jgi:hypothetical protein